MPVPFLFSNWRTPSGLKLLTFIRLLSRSLSQIRKLLRSDGAQFTFDYVGWVIVAFGLCSVVDWVLHGFTITSSP